MCQGDAERGIFRGKGKKVKPPLKLRIAVKENGRGEEGGAKIATKLPTHLLIRLGGNVGNNVGGMQVGDLDPRKSDNCFFRGGREGTRAGKKASKHYV